MKGKKRTEADFSEYYTINSLNYSDGVYSIDFVAKAEDLPLQTLPAKLIQTLRDLDEVYYVEYAGYSVATVTQEAAGGVDADGNPVAGEETTTETQTFTMEVQFKGDGIELDAEEEAE